MSIASIIRSGVWFILTLLLGCSVWASPGEISHVLSHDRTKVITDPTTGVNPFPRWAVFPSRSHEYRKVVLYVTYQCPDSQHCGEWDYIDAIYLRRVGGQSAPSKNIEIARMISPYGWRFGSTWKFTWHVDITDFALLLHDSVEVEFNHTGYERSDDRGWLITLDFALTEGPPAMAVLGMDTLWNGFFPYGDSSKPIEKALTPIRVTAPSGAMVARVRILQTGHGMDDSENCAEFCDKWREVLLDDTVIDRRQIWKTCGDNPLFPQAGTWLYNRANWCPGSIVHPDCYNRRIAPSSPHTVAMRMEPYTNYKQPTANYRISSQIFYCKKPWARNDVSLEEIIAPSSADEYSRMNPICAAPRIRMKNSGSEPLRSAAISYGIVGMLEETYVWNGLLGSQESIELSLPGVLRASEGNRQFHVEISRPNGKKDEYRQDNEMTVPVAVPPIFAPRFVLAFRSNTDSSHNSWTIKDGSGNVVRERKSGSFGANTTYYDTLDLSPGCYHLQVVDTAGDGLDFWANPEGGYGYVRLLDFDGRLLRAFGSDFGSGIEYWFMVAQDAQPAVVTKGVPIVNPFPVRNRGTFTLEIFFNEPTAAEIRVTTEDSSRIVFESRYSSVKEAFPQVDISAEPDGVYVVKVISEGKTTARRIRVKHGD